MIELAAASDAELMAQVQTGDRDAFAGVVERYKDPLVGYLARLTGNRDRAEELAQDAFVRLYESAPNYREQGRLAPLLYRIAVNLLRSEERRARRFRLLSHLLPFVGPPPPASPQAEVLRSEAHRRLAAAVAQLPLTYRVPLVLRDVEDWSYEAIAEAIDIPTGTAKSRVSRARQQLREKLGPYVGRRATAAHEEEDGGAA